MLRQSLTIQQPNVAVLRAAERALQGSRMIGGDLVSPYPLSPPAVVAVEQRAAVLATVLAPASERDVSEVILDLSASFPQTRQADPVRTVALYKATLGTLPGVPLRAAANEFIVGKAGDGRFMPPAATVAIRTRQIADPYERELSMLRRALLAIPEPPPVPKERRVEQAAGLRAMFKIAPMEDRGDPRRVPAPSGRSLAELNEAHIETLAATYAAAPVKPSDGIAATLLEPRTTGKPEGKNDGR